MIAPRMFGRAAWLVALVFAGCLEGAPPDGAARCAATPEPCPRGYLCAADGRCWRRGHGPDLSVAYDLAPPPDLMPPSDLALPACDPSGGCGAAPDVCHDAPACVAGHCVSRPKANGTICDDPMNACKKPGRCNDGVCGAVTTVSDGTSCTTPTNPCRAPGTCKAGVCGPESNRPDGYHYDTSDYKFRCCGAQPARLDQSPNCGACGILCASGFLCTNAGATNNKQYWCTCGGLNSKCWSNCCALPDNLCSPSNCQNMASCVGCPAGSICEATQSPHYYCHY